MRSLTLTWQWLQWLDPSRNMKGRFPVVRYSCLGWGFILMLCFFLQHSKIPKIASVNIYMFHVFMAEMPMLFLCISKFFHIFVVTLLRFNQQGPRWPETTSWRKSTDPIFDLWTLILHIIYILYTYYIHITYILYTYYIHITYILFTYHIHIIYILYTYYTHIIHILYTYYIHIIYILYTYYTHIIHILYIHIIYILYT